MKITDEADDDDDDEETLYWHDKHVSDVITPAHVKCLLSSRHTCSLQGAESVRMKPLCDWWCDVRRCWGGGGKPQ